MAIGLAMFRPATAVPVFRVPGSNTANCEGRFSINEYINVKDDRLLKEEQKVGY